MESKNKDSMDLDIMKRIIKQLSNEFMDMKMNNGEGT
jgi:hypothetical protein